MKKGKEKVRKRFKKKNEKKYESEPGKRETVDGKDGRRGKEKGE